METVVEKQRLMQNPEMLRFIFDVVCLSKPRNCRATRKGSKSKQGAGHVWVLADEGLDTTQVKVKNIIYPGRMRI